MNLSAEQMALIELIATTVHKATELAMEAGYQLAGDSLVARPGKFEGNPWYTPYYWDCVLNGCGEDVGAAVQTTRLEVSEAARAAFNIPRDVVSVLLWESDSGFVYLHLETKQERF